MDLSLNKETMVFLCWDFFLRSHLSIDFGCGHLLVMIGAIKVTLSTWKWLDIWALILVMVTH